ncbi:hypothetical protein B7463_g2764, partial [Scytalidium lignicola]
MSLFGNQNTAQNRPSLFSTPATSTATGATPGGSLFGSLGAKPATSSLFGASSNQQQQQQPQAGGGLFGSLGTASQPQQQQQTTGTGLFGGLGSTSQPQAQQSGSGLFGGLNPNSQPQQQASTSLFGGGLGASTANQQQVQPVSQSSLLGSTQIPSQSQSQQNGPSGAYFDAILEKSRKRAHGHEEGAAENLPSLQLGLGDLRQRIKRLGPGVQERGVDGRAHYLLAASGVDPGAAVRDISFFNAQSTKLDRTALQGPSDTDVEGYLSKLQSQTTLTMISDGLARSVRDFDAFLEDNVTMEWDAQRKRIYQHFGIKPREDSNAPGEGSSFAASAIESRAAFGRSRRTKGSPAAGSRTNAGLSGSSFGRSAMQKSVIGTPVPMGSGRSSLFTDVEKKVETNSITTPDPSDRFVREKQSKFIEKVQSLNISRIRKTPYPILHEFASVASQPGEQHSQEFAKAYRALIDIIGENPTVESLSDVNAVKERQCAEGYLDEVHNSQKHVKIKKMILRGSTRYLEKQFYEEMETLVAKNPREANLGGVPNVISKVKAYVRIRAARKDLVPDNTGLQMLGDDYVWALIFYLLRSGHVQEAAEYVTSNAVAFRAIDRSFAAYITDYNNSSERRLRRELQDRINSEYNQRLRIAPEHSIDPFRMACYKVIGRCDLAKRNLDGLNQSMDDFTWLQFNLAREVNRVEEIASEVYGLTDVQVTVQEIGNRYFSKGAADVNGQYGLFFYLQILAGMFEQAIEYLYPFQYVDTVHFAIALDYYGLLRVSNPSVADTDLMSYTTKGHPQISFGRMLGYYTRDFRAANVGAAVDYLSLICLNQDLPGELGRKQASLCHEALRELVLESREYALLLGDIRSDGVRIKGAIEERMGLIGLEDTDDFMRTVTIQAASVADDNGRTTDAVLLYHLAGEYDNVIAVITRALSEAVAIPIGQDQMKLQPLKPRTTEAAKHEVGTSLSLTSVDDPVILAKNMIDLYKTNMMFLDKIKPENKDACSVLLQMSSAKVKVEESRWTEALDIIVTLDILPLEARGNPSVIRGYATKFSALSQPVANNVPNLLMWTILCCNSQRNILTNGQFGGNEGTRRMMIDDLKQKNLDLTTASATPPSRCVTSPMETRDIIPSPKEESQSPAEDNRRPRRRPTSGRSISTLTPEQQQKKRINDREAQRASRARAKAELEALHREIAELKSQKPYLELQRAINEKELVEAENRSIKRRLAEVMGALRSIIGDNAIDGGTPDTCSLRDQLSSAQSAPRNPNLSVATPISLPSPINHSDNQWQASSSKNSPDHERNAQTQQKQEMTRGLDIGAERMGLNFLLDDTQRTKKILPEIHDSQNFQPMGPGSRSQLEFKINSMANYDNPNLQLEIKAHLTPVKNSAPTCPLDSILLNFLHEWQKQAAEGVPAPSLIGPAYPSVASLLNPAVSLRSHRLSKILTDILATFPDLSTLPERIAVLYIMFLLMRWQISPTPENYDRLPDWLTPRPCQLFTTHPHWVNYIPWPKMRDKLVRDYNCIENLFDDFFIPFTTTLSLNWPYAPMDTLLSSPGGSEEFVINPIFERHLRDLGNWSLGTSFAEAYPKLADTCRIKPDGYRKP